MGLRLLVYRPGAIGDTILTLPALAALRRRFPEAHITWAGNAACLPLLPVEEAMSADDMRLLPLFGDPPQAIADIHVVFARSLGAMGGASRPTDMGGGEPLVGIQRDPLEAVARGVHVAEWLVDAIDPSFEDRVPRLEVEPGDGAPMVIHAGAGSAGKRWSDANFEAVAEALRMPLAIVQGPADPEPAISRRHEIWRELPLAELAKRLKGSGLFIGNDSGISHLAAAVGMPAIAVYVATDPAVWGIRGERARCAEPSIEAVLRAANSLGFRA